MSGQIPNPFDRAVHLSITSDTANVSRVRAAVTDAARFVGFDDPDVSAITTAIDEAVCNVIKHGYQGCGGQPIEVTLEPVRDGDRAGLQVTICDCGRQVAPEEIVGRDLDDIRPGGLGTHIINTVMDDVSYSCREPTGMQLRLVKMIPADPPGEEA